MQEHIRRAHPDHYIPKLPATEESFQLMISTPPSARPAPQLNSSSPFAGNNGTSRDSKGGLGQSPGSFGRELHHTGYSPPAPARHGEEYPAAATAAVALAQLHSQRQDSDWGSEAVRSPNADHLFGAARLMQSGKRIGS